MKATDRASLPPRGKEKIVRRDAPPTELDVKVELIQMLIPIALERVNELLQEEVTELAGRRYSREAAAYRWGKQRGSVYLGEQKVPIEVPRLREAEHHREIPLESYHRLQTAQATDEVLFHKILHGLSCRQYKRTVRLIPQAFGVSAGTVSRRFVHASAHKLRQLMQRRLEGYEIVALVLDGKALADAQMVVALGITTEGQKIILGFVESASENSQVCIDFLRQLVERGLSYQSGLLVVIDGAKGFRKAITAVFGDYACVQRCQWHKRENVVAYLPKNQQAAMRQRLQQAYEQPTYEQAKQELGKIRQELGRFNQSAVTSLDEGFEETLTLHRLGLFKELGISLKTTNCLESINAHIQRLTRKVTSWRTSDQRQRWLASALLDVEPQLRKIKGYRHLPLLQQALQRHLNIAIATAA